MPNVAGHHRQAVLKGGGRYRFTVDELARMGEAGIFAEDNRVEPIVGEIVGE